MKTKNKSFVYETWNIIDCEVLGKLKLKWTTTTIDDAIKMLINRTRWKYWWLLMVYWITYIFNDPLWMKMRRSIKLMLDSLRQSRDETSEASTIQWLLFFFFLPTSKAMKGDCCLKITSRSCEKKRWEEWRSAVGSDNLFQIKFNLKFQFVSGWNESLFRNCCSGELW